MGVRAVFRSHKRRKPSDQLGRTDAEVNETVITQCKEISPVESTGKCELGYLFSFLFTEFLTKLSMQLQTKKTVNITSNHCSLPFFLLGPPRGEGMV